MESFYSNIPENLNPQEEKVSVQPKINDNQFDDNTPGNEKLMLEMVNEEEKKNKESQNKIKDVNTNPILVENNKNAPMVGLTNNNNTCYLNSCLQCLANVPSLYRHFSSQKNQQFYLDNINTTPLCYTFSRLFIHLFPNSEQESKIYNPSSLHKIICYINPLFKGTSIKDPIELLMFLFEELHKENKSVRKQKISNFKEQNVDEKNESQVLAYFVNNKMGNNESIFLNKFAWVSRCIKECIKCKIPLYSFEYYFTFDFDIEEMRKNVFKDNYFCLTDCLENYIAKTDLFNIFCSECHSKSNFKIERKIYTSANYLIFLLRFEKNNQNIKFNIEKQIDIDKYIFVKNSSTKYELISFVSYENEKYVAYSLSHIDNKWYYYNDEIVKQKNIDEIISDQNNKILPTILFYQKIENK